MISRFFIDRPIFAAVISIALTLAGAIAVVNLPIAQYPPIAPPTVQVSCTYPGASSRVVADTIAAPIEQQVNGVEGMLYMSSQSANDGSYNLTITFELGTNLNTALVTVQNRVALAMPQLPDSVQKQGLTIKKKSPNILLVVNFFSPKGRYNDIYLSNYATIFVKDELARLPGVGDVTYLGQRDYSIRAWLDPQKLAVRGITASDVANAIANQSTPAAAGQIGAQPSRTMADFQLPIDTLGRLSQPEQFANIVIKSQPSTSDNPAPQFVHVGDVARVELGAQNYTVSCRVDSLPSVGLAIFQLPGTNALDVAAGVRAKMESLKSRFPDDVDYGIYYDTTPFIRESVADVVKTLLEAIVLVGIVVLAFLQSWRATLIPLIAVPVAIVGTFAVMAALGFSLNNISLFGLVLAIGIVVDDAIVVVENVERWLEQGLPAREAARRAMDEVTGPVVAVALVLCAVFMPCAFIKGITGEFYRQFAVTISVSTVFSALNSLTLSPALAAILLKPHGTRPDVFARFLNTVLGWFFQAFNAGFRVGTDVYGRFVGMTLRVCVIALLVYAGLLGLTGWLFGRYPVGFIPQQDQGWLLIDAQLPDSSAVQRTQEVMAHIERIARKTEGVAHTMAVSGQSILMGTNSSNFGSMFVILKPFHERRSRDLSASALLLKLREEAAREIPDARIGVYGAPPVPGIGLAAGFKLIVEDRGSLGLVKLQAATDELVAKAAKIPHMIVAPTIFRSNTPQLYLDIDRTKAESLGVSVNDVNETLQIFLGSYYVNNFNEFGRYWQVNLQANGIYRNRVEDLKQLFIRNKTGDMVPLGTLVRVRDVGGPVMVTRYNLYQAAPVMGGALPPLSSGQGIKIMEHEAAETLPPSMSTEWTELTFMQIKAGNTAIYIFGAAVVFVFLVLAAQYESWTLPLARGLHGVFNSSRVDTPWLYLDIDRTKCLALGISLSDLFNTLQVYLGSYYVNNFNEFGRSWQVNVMGTADARERIEKIRELKVATTSKQMVPLATLLQVRDSSGPLMLMRHNMYSSAAVTGNLSPGTSSGQAIRLVEKIADEVLPHSMAYDWTELTYMQLEAGNTAMYVFALAVVFVFLVLAAQYESWLLPLAVILVVPMCLLCSVVGVALAHMDLNIFTQIGLIVLVGLASKNAILIVEFAKQEHEAGKPRREATLNACRLRLRPILMTSFAFILGVVPLVIAEGAGAEMRRTLGTAVFSGMIGVTLFGVFLTPVFFYTVQWFGEKRLPSQGESEPLGHAQ